MDALEKKLGAPLAVGEEEETRDCSAARRTAAPGREWVRSCRATHTATSGESRSSRRTAFSIVTEAPVLWPPDAKSWLIGKDPDAGKD